MGILKKIFLAQIVIAIGTLTLISCDNQDLIEDIETNEDSSMENISFSEYNYTSDSIDSENHYLRSEDMLNIVDSTSLKKNSTKKEIVIPLDIKQSKKRDSKQRFLKDSITYRYRIKNRLVMLSFKKLSRKKILSKSIESLKKHHIEKTKDSAIHIYSKKYLKKKRIRRKDKRYFILLEFQT